MAKRLTVLLAVLALVVFAAAGCGDDDGDDGNGATDTVTDTVTTEETVTEDETVTEETDTGAGGGAAAPQSREQAADQCRESLEGMGQLSGDAREELRDFCDTIGSGDPEEVRESAREVCRTVIEETVPEGTPGRQTALDACERNLSQQQ